MSFCKDPRRRERQNPEGILEDLGLRKGNIFVDVGCGYGFFTLPAAGIVGREGKVYCVDVDQDSISALEKKSLSEDLDNITLKAGRAEETLFCDSCADFVFFGVDLHDFDNPSEVLTNARKMLKPSGKLIDLD